MYLVILGEHTFWAVSKKNLLTKLYSLTGSSTLATAVSEILGTPARRYEWNSIDLYIFQF